MDYRPIDTEDNNCRKCTVPYGSTYIRATHSKPGTRSILEARYNREECIPRPDHFSMDSGPLSFIMTQNHADSDPIRSSGIWRVLRTSLTDRGVQGGSGPTMKFRGRASRGRWRHWTPQGLCLSGKPIPRA